MATPNGDIRIIDQPMKADAGRPQAQNDPSSSAQPEQAQSHHQSLTQEENEVDLHSQVSDLSRKSEYPKPFRKGIRNWKIAIRLIGWMACRSCCVSSAKCCPAGASSDVDDDRDHRSVADLNCRAMNGDGVVSSNFFEIEHHGGNRQIVNVPPGMVGLAWLGSEPLFLGSGTHCFTASNFTLQDFALETSRVIHHAHLHRVLIPEGLLGIAWIEGQPQILEPGIWIKSSLSFAYTPADDRPIDEKEFVLGPYRIVTISSDEVGIKFSNRRLQLLLSGRHLIDISKAEVFSGFVSLEVHRSNMDLFAISKEEIAIEAQATFNWQISPEDAGAAHAACIVDIENSVITKVQRAFAMVFWNMSAQDIKDCHFEAGSKDVSNVCLNSEFSENGTEFSMKWTKKFLDTSIGLFEEGWKVTLWDMHLENIRFQRRTKIELIEESLPASKTSLNKKKKVHIIDSGVPNGHGGMASSNFMVPSKYSEEIHGM